MYTKHWMIFNGVDTRDVGVVMEQAPPIVRAPRRTTKIDVEGRDGTLTILSDDYANYIKTADIVLRKFDYLDDVMALFRGSGWAVFSNEPDKRYRVSIDDQIDWTRLIRNIGRITIPMDCYPFKYERHPEKIDQAVASSGPRMIELIARGTRYALPKITLYGTGPCTITTAASGVSQSAEINVFSETVTIDGEMQEVYQGDAPANHLMTGTFPRLEPGVLNTLTLSYSAGKISRITIEPRWRWY